MYNTDPMPVLNVLEYDVNNGSKQVLVHGGCMVCGGVQRLGWVENFADKDTPGPARGSRHRVFHARNIANSNTQRSGGMFVYMAPIRGTIIDQPSMVDSKPTLARQSALLQP